MLIELRNRVAFPVLYIVILMVWLISEKKRTDTPPCFKGRKCLFLMFYSHTNSGRDKAVLTAWIPVEKSEHRGI